MNKKNKRKILARVCAIIGIFAILASLCLIPASAWDLTDVHFYNYFNCGAFSLTSIPNDDHKIANIIGTDVGTGVIALETVFDGTYPPYVPYTHTPTLREICPDMVVGETYVLSLEAEINFTGETVINIEAPTSIRVGSLEWRSGEALVVTEDILNKNITLFAGRVFKSVDCVSAIVNLKIWVNKNSAQPFCPYNWFSLDADEAYEKGYIKGFEDNASNSFEDGYAEGYKYGYADAFDVYYDEVSLLTEATFEKFEYKYEKNTTNSVSYERDLTYMQAYTFDGFSFSGKSVPQYGGIPPEGYYYSGFSVEFDVSSKKFYFGDVSIRVQGENIVRCMVYLTTESGYSFSSGFIEATNGSLSTLVTDFTYMGNNKLVGGEKIDKITFVCRVDPSLELDCADATMTFFSTNSYEYAKGYKDGKEDGAYLGAKESFDAGYDEGYEWGFLNGETKGKEEGYYQGRSDEQEHSGFFGMISAVVDVPVRAFKSLFNFEILGTDMTSFALSIVSLSLIVAVIKMVI